MTAMLQESHEHIMQPPPCLVSLLVSRRGRGWGGQNNMSSANYIGFFQKVSEVKSNRRMMRPSDCCLRCCCSARQFIQAAATKRIQLGSTWIDAHAISHDGSNRSAVMRLAAFLCDYFPVLKREKHPKLGKERDFLLLDTWQVSVRFLVRKK